MEPACFRKDATWPRQLQLSSQFMTSLGGGDTSDCGGGGGDDDEGRFVRGTRLISAFLRTCGGRLDFPIHAEVVSSGAAINAFQRGGPTIGSTIGATSA